MTEQDVITSIYEGLQGYQTDRYQADRTLSDYLSSTGEGSMYDNRAFERTFGNIDDQTPRVSPSPRAYVHQSQDDDDDVKSKLTNHYFLVNFYINFF